MGCWEVTLLCYVVYSVNGKARSTGRFWVMVWLLTESLTPVTGEVRSSAKPYASSSVPISCPFSFWHRDGGEAHQTGCTSQPGRREKLGDV